MIIVKTKKLLSNFLLSDYIIIFITCFFLVYSLFSSNVPREISFEHYVMLFLAILTAVLYIIEICKLNINEFLKANLWPILIFLVIIYGTILGFIFENSTKNIVRDIFGVSSILSIFVLSYFKEKNQKYLKLIFKVLIFTGLIFSFKSLFFYNFILDYGNYPEDNPIQVSKFHFLYLENTVILCMVYFLLKIYDSTKKKNFFKFSKYLLLLFFPFSVISNYALRGPILFTFVFLIIFFAIKRKSLNGLLFSFIFLINNFFIYFFFISYILFYFIFHTKKKIVYILVSLAILLFILDHIFLWSSNISSLTHQNFLQDHLIKKFSIDFGNNRFKEYFYLFANLNLKDAFLGTGFGALFLNPVNNSIVLFFHSFVLYYFYKLGIIGFIFSFIILLSILHKCRKLYLNYEYLGDNIRNISSSLLVTICYPLVLSATYKSITFGFILAFFLITNISRNYAKNI